MLHQRPGRQQGPGNCNDETNYLGNDEARDTSHGAPREQRHEEEHKERALSDNPPNA